MPIGIQTKESKSKFETRPLNVEAKISVQYDISS